MKEDAHIGEVKTLITMINESTTNNANNDEESAVHVSTHNNPEKLSPEKGVTVMD